MAFRPIRRRSQPADLAGSGENNNEYMGCIKIPVMDTAERCIQTGKGADRLASRLRAGLGAAAGPWWSAPGGLEGAVHPGYRSARRDIELLGVRVGTQPQPGARPYAIVDLGSQARRWLLPLGNRRVLVSSLALTQSAPEDTRWRKQAAGALARCGLGALWARPSVHVEGVPFIARYVSDAPDEPLEFAYLASRQGLDRKLTVQVMDEKGSIRGYGKIGRGIAAARLRNEALMLRQLVAWDLASARVPRVLHESRAGAAQLLVTDALASPEGRSDGQFSERHLRFVQEMIRIGGLSGSGARPAYGPLIRERLEAFWDRLAPSWRRRLQAVADLVCARDGALSPPGPAHGNLAPWNCRADGDGLYVVDWEHAVQEWPAVLDAVHFVVSSARARGRPAPRRLALAADTLRDCFNVRGEFRLRAHLALYLVVQALARAEHLHGASPEGDPRADDLASIFDAFLET